MNMAPGCLSTGFGELGSNCSFFRNFISRYESVDVSLQVLRGGLICRCSMEPRFLRYWKGTE